MAAASTVLLVACGGPTDPGERVFLRKCAGCHGRDGRGRTRIGATHPEADLAAGVLRHGEDFESIRRIIARGNPGSPMPAYEGRLSPAEIDAVTRYVEELPARARPTPAPEAAVPR